MLLIIAFAPWSMFSFINSTQVDLILQVALFGTTITIMSIKQRNNFIMIEI
jgi:hypothetical protein